MTAGAGTTAPRNLSRLLDPQSVAIVGASDNPAKFGARPIMIMQQFGFAGGILPVNPGRETIAGLPCYPSLRSLPQAPDSVIIALPAARVLETIEEAVEVGAGSAVIYSSGFAETGAQGKELQSRIRTVAREAGLLLLGPNCQGAANFRSGASTNFSSLLLDTTVKSGRTTIIGQSGMLTGQVLRGMQHHGVGLSHLVANGNEIDVTASEVCTYLADDPLVTTIVMVIEGLQSGRDFIEAATACARSGKNLVVLKTGRAPASAAATQSHTAAMSVDSAVFDAVCQRLGVVQARDIDELVDVAVCLASGRSWRPDPRVLILSNSGGMGAIMADTASDVGLEVPELSAKTTEVATTLLPTFIAARNPLDLSVLALEDPEKFGSLLKLVMSDGDVGHVQLFIGGHKRDVARISNAIISSRDGSDKPLSVIWRGGDPAVAEALRAEGIPTFEDPSRSLRAGSLLVAAQQHVHPVEMVERVRHGEASVGLWGHHWDEAHEIEFARHGVSSLPTRVVKDEDTAVATAQDIGYPVALKVSSAVRTHKSDFGGLILGIDSDSSLRTAFTTLAESMTHDEAIIVQRMGPSSAAEILVSVRDDPTFGPVAIVGTGGVHVESWNDAFALCPPITFEHVRHGVESLRSWPGLKAERGQPGIDLPALFETVRGLIDVFLDMPAQMETLEVNPVLVGKPGVGAWVADWRCDVSAPDDESVAHPTPAADHVQ